MRIFIHIKSKFLGFLQTRLVYFLFLSFIVTLEKEFFMRDDLCDDIYLVLKCLTFIYQGQLYKRFKCQLSVT